MIEAHAPTAVRYCPNLLSPSLENGFQRPTSVKVVGSGVNTVNEIRLPAINGRDFYVSPAHRVVQSHPR